jgi:hypothetical protein
MNRTQIIERERRWALPAALAAFLGAMLLVAGVIVHLQITSSSSAGDALIQLSNHGQALILSSFLQAAGLLLLAPPLSYLLAAAASRSPRVRMGFIAFCVVGPLLFSIQTVMGGYALKAAGDNFVAQKDSEQTQSFGTLQQAIKSDPSKLDKVSVYNDADTAEVQTSDGTFYSVSYPGSQEKALLDSLDKASVDTSQDSGGKVGDALANHLLFDSSKYKTAANLALPAGLTIIFAVVYPAIQAFRVGLITRMISTLGAISVATLIIVPLLAPALIGLWITWMGLVFLNRTPRPRPPAWEAGVAIPWPRPGQAPPPDAPVEGTAREVDPDAPAANPPRQRGERRKRKRRE